MPIIGDLRYRHNISIFGERSSSTEIISICVCRVTSLEGMVLLTAIKTPPPRDPLSFL